MLCNFRSSKFVENISSLPHRPLVARQPHEKREKLFLLCCGNNNNSNNNRVAQPMTDCPTLRNILINFCRQAFGWPFSHWSERVR